MKTVIITWKQEVKNLWRHGLHNYWGFGDMIRGVCGVFDVCEELGYTLYVDMRHHPIHHFFKNIEHGFESIIDENKEDIILDIFSSRNSIIEKLCNKFENSDIYFNAMWVDPYIFSNNISSKNKDFLKRILTPTDEFSEYIASRLPRHPYNILHFRLGDTCSSLQTIIDNNKYIHLMHQYGKPHDIVISDNNQLKHIVRETLSEIYSVTDNDQCHIGIETDLEKIKGTLYEFMLASRSIHINTYTVYSWISGFVHAIHHIYDVPIICMR